MDLALDSAVHAFCGAGVRVLTRERTLRRCQAQAAEEYTGDYSAYEADQRFLVDRPTDVEVGEWLGHDTRLILREALAECGLRARDLHKHLVITERAPWCWRARTEGGPPRYSVYRVTVFLMTARGIRRYVVDLDFLGGALGDHTRTGFQYDKVAAATVTDDVHTVSGQRRWQYLLEDRRAATPEELREEGRVSDPRFRVALVSGHTIRIVVENFDHWADDGEDVRELIAQAREAAGIDTAVRTMEAIATDGEDWILRERRRYLRRLAAPSERAVRHPGPALDPVGAVVINATAPALALEPADVADPTE